MVFTCVDSRIIRKMSYMPPLKRMVFLGHYEEANLDTLRYLSLHDNHYVRYFKGHKKQVISLEISPTDEQFLSAGLDDTVRLWNMNSSNCQGCLNVPSPSLAAFDPTGIIFAVVSHPLSTLMLYDLRNYDKEPFSVFPIQDDAYLQTITYPPRMPEFSKLEFSNDGRSILVGTSGGVHYVLDAFHGGINARLVDHVPNPQSGLTSGDVCFTPDGKFVIGGSGDNKIAIWDIQQPPRENSVSPVHKLDAKGFGTPSVVAINPRSALLATASTELVLSVCTSC